MAKSVARVDREVCVCVCVWCMYDCVYSMHARMGSSRSWKGEAQTYVPFRLNSETVLFNVS